MSAPISEVVIRRVKRGTRLHLFAVTTGITRSLCSRYTRVFARAAEVVGYLQCRACGDRVKRLLLRQEGSAS